MRQETLSPDAPAPAAPPAAHAATPLERDAQTFLDSLAARGLKPATIYTYRRALEGLKRVARERGHRDWRDVGPKTIAAYFDACREWGIRPARREVQTFVLYLARRGIPMDATVAMLASRRWGRPKVDDPHHAHALTAAVESFLDWGQRVRRWSPNTVLAYRRGTVAFRNFAIARGLLTWRAVKGGVVDDYFRELHARGRSAATARQHWAQLKGLMEYLDARGERHNDPRDLGSAPRLRKRLPDHLSEAEVSHLLDSIVDDDAIALRDRALLEFLYASAARASEVGAVTLAGLDLEGRRARLIGKGDRERVVSFTDSAAAAIAAYLERGRPRLAVSRRIDNLFLNFLGEPLSRMSVGVTVKRRARAAGIVRRVYVHLLRHSCATHLVARGVPLQIVQEHLGHLSITTTTIYAHLDNRQVADAVRAALPRR